jgi:hypothetical protein
MYSSKSLLNKIVKAYIPYDMMEEQLSSGNIFFISSNEMQSRLMSVLSSSRGLQDIFKKNNFNTVMPGAGGGPNSPPPGPPPAPPGPPPAPPAPPEPATQGAPSAQAGTQQAYNNFTGRPPPPVAVPHGDQPKVMQQGIKNPTSSPPPMFTFGNSASSSGPPAAAQAAMQQAYNIFTGRPPPPVAVPQGAQPKPMQQGIINPTISSPSMFVFGRTGAQSGTQQAYNNFTGRPPPLVAVPPGAQPKPIQQGVKKPSSSSPSSFVSGRNNQGPPPPPGAGQATTEHYRMDNGSEPGIDEPDDEVSEGDPETHVVQPIEADAAEMVLNPGNRSTLTSTAPMIPHSTNDQKGPPLTEPRRRQQALRRTVNALPLPATIQKQNDNNNQGPPPGPGHPGPDTSGPGQGPPPGAASQSLHNYAPNQFNAPHNNPANYQAMAHARAQAEAHATHQAAQQISHQLAQHQQEKEIAHQAALHAINQATQHAMLQAAHQAAQHAANIQPSTAEAHAVHEAAQRISHQLA